MSSLDLKFLGNKLSKCRQLLQFEVREVALGTGISDERIASFEQGKLEPLGDEILILADFYKEDFNLFISNEKKSVSEKIDILYRKFGNDFSKSDRWAIKEFLYLCECEQDIWNLLHVENKKFHFENRIGTHKNQGISAAKQLRQFLGYSGNNILNDIYSEFRKIGIHVFRRRLENSAISGLFIMHPYAGECVLVNYTEDFYRQNFTVSHEIGHAIFDNGDDINVSRSTDEKWDYKEIRANNFASSFLIPDDALKGLRVSSWTIPIVQEVAKQLKTNVTPLLIRLSQLKLITDFEFEALKKGYIKGSEKLDFELEGLENKQKQNKQKLIERGLSTVYVRKCFEAYSNALISRKRLSEMLLTDEVELPNILSPFGLQLIWK